MEPAALGSDYVEFHSGVPLLLPSPSPDREIHKTPRPADMGSTSSKRRFRSRSQPLGRRFRRDVALRTGEHFISHHEFPHCGRPQEWRVEVRVKVPFWMGLPISRPLVKAHRVRKRNSKNIVITRGKTLQNIGQPTSSTRVYLVQPSAMLVREHEHLKRPNSPKWHYNSKELIGANQALAACFF